MSKYSSDIVSKWCGNMDDVSLDGTLAGGVAWPEAKGGRAQRTANFDRYSLTGGSILLLAAVYLSAVSAAALVLYSAAILVTAIRMAGVGRLRPFGAVAILFGLWWVAFGAAVGSLPSLDEVVPFANSEARVLLALVPVVLMATASDRTGAISAVTTGFQLVAWGAPVLLIVWIVSREGVTGRTGLLHGFTSSHHVPGVLFGTVLILCVAVPLYRRPAIRGCLAVCAALVVLLSGSRASMAGLVFVGAAIIVTRGWMTPRRRPIVLGVAAVAAVLMALYVPRATTTLTSIARPEFRDAIALAVRTGDAEVARRVGSEGPADANVLSRLAYFHRATDMWWSSPLIGTGPFRFDDDDVRQSGIAGFIYPITAGTKVFSDQQAHNLHLYLLAEGGLVSVVLFLGLWLNIGWSLRRGILGNVVVMDQQYVRAGGAAIVFGFGVSLSDMGFLTPGLAVPVGLLACAAKVAVEEAQQGVGGR